MYSLYFHSKTFNERIWHTKKIKRHLSLLKLYAKFVMHVDFYLVIFFREKICHSIIIYCNHLIYKNITG